MKRLTNLTSLTKSKIAICAASAIAIAAATVMVACDGQQKVRFDEQNDAHKASYVIGRSIGSDLRDMYDTASLPLDMNVVLMAVMEAFDSLPLRLSDSVMAAVDTDTKRSLREMRVRRQRQLVEGNLRASQEFLRENAARAGVVTTESGLQYVVEQEGGGAKPTANDRVRVHYRGTLIDGTVFDDSFARGEPITFAVTGVILGWTEGLQLMTVGSRYRFFIPPELAYGSRGQGGRIGPNAALIFDVELIEILPPDA